MDLDTMLIELRRYRDDLAERCGYDVEVMVREIRERARARELPAVSQGVPVDADAIKIDGVARRTIGA